MNRAIESIPAERPRTVRLPSYRRLSRTEINSAFIIKWSKDAIAAMTDTNDSYRRTVLRTVGAVGALFGVSGVASAGGKTDGHDHDHDHDHDDDD
ncbi:hypothetical protein BRC68_06485, partial [Halobacteriales archaeon QH_6_64_20]